MRKLAGAAALLVVALVMVAAAFAEGRNEGGDGRDVSTLAVYGDAPYGTSPTDTVEFDASPRFIDSINADPDVQLVVHAGDIHSGKQYCTQAYDESILQLWSRFADPLVYTPGDNEWTDCHKPGEGGNVKDASGNPVDYANGNPLANLALVRSLFFPRAGVTLGQRKQRVLSQAQVWDWRHPSDREYVENTMWLQSRVLMVTLNIPGGSNNDTDPWYGAPLTGEQSSEVANRTGADLRWLDAAFVLARLARAEGVVIVEQADMWDLDGKPAAHISEYAPFVDSIASHTTAFKKPVLLFNGDSHVYLSDNPLAASNPLNSLHPGHDVANFHRVVVHGSTLPLEWLRLTIDPRAIGNGSTAFGPFSWARVIVS